jgi:type IV pilus assembly protein PilQ
MVISLARTVGLAASLVVGAVLATASLASAEVQAVSQVEVQEEQGLTRIILRGARDPIYTAFMLSKPSRLLVDMPDVVFEGTSSPISVQNGVVGDVTLGAFGDPSVSPSVARVSIALLREVDYEVRPDADEVVVEIRPKGAASVNAPEPFRVDTKATETPMAPEKSVDRDKASTAQAVSRIVRVASVDGGIEVRAEGPVDNVDSFVVHGPERLVVDFWGTVNGVTSQTIPLDNVFVQQVRIGEHPDKVRVVLDLAGPARAHSVEPIEDGVRIIVDGDASVVAEPEEATADSSSLPAAPSPEPVEDEAEGTSDAVEPSDGHDDASPDTDGVAEPTRPTPTFASSAQVKSVHFESYAEADRVVVALDQPIRPIVAEPDSATVVVDLPGARISEEVERRVDTREFGGPVQMLSAFQTPDVEHDQARVVLKRRGSGSPRLEWDGPTLLIEFDRSGFPGASVAPDGTATPQGSTPPAAIEPGGAALAGGSMQPVAYLPDDDLYSGPSDPASIDILEEGGFTEEKEYEGRRVSLDFKDAEIGNILRLIADVSDLNIIAGEEVSGMVTVRLVEIPWDQALDVILMTKGLGFSRIGKVLRIAPLEILKQEEEQRLQERRARERLEDLVVKLQPVSYANVKEVEKLIKKLLSPRGTVNIDKRTNTLIMKDIPSVINEATALVKAIDTQTPQVLIESKIVEANLNFSRDLGAVFGFGYNPLGADGRTGQGGAQDFRLGDGGNAQVPGFGTGSQATNFIVSNPIAAAAGTLTMGLLGLDDHLQLDLQLQAAEANTKAKVISSPRVVTLDNSEAKILQGVAIAFASSDGDQVNTQFIDAVLELKVTPHITADRTIIMDIKVTRNAPRIDTSTGDDTGIAKNEADTELLVFDGQTAVLGGIYVVEKSNRSSKVPFLADIPLLGVAFRNKNLFDERRELLIFVTPRIVRGMTPAS